MAFVMMGTLLLGAAFAAGIEAWHFGGKGWRERHADLIFALTLLAIAVSALAVVFAYVGAATRFKKSKNQTAKVLRHASPKPDEKS
jgi:uncharacterized membrane protein YkvI